MVLGMSNRTLFICLRVLAIGQSVNVLYDRGFGTSSDLQELETEGIRSTSRMGWRLTVGHVSSMCPWWQEIKVLPKILDTRGSGELPWLEILGVCGHTQMLGMSIVPDTAGKG